MASTSCPTRLAAALSGILLMAAGVLVFAFVEGLATSGAFTPFSYAVFPGTTISLLAAAFYVRRYRGGVGYAVAGAAVLTGYATAAVVGKTIEDFSVWRLILSALFVTGVVLLWLPDRKTITRRRAENGTAAGQ